MAYCSSNAASLISPLSSALSPCSSHPGHTGLHLGFITELCSIYTLHSVWKFLLPFFCLAHCNSSFRTQLTVTLHLTLSLFPTEQCVLCTLIPSCVSPLLQLAKKNKKQTKKNTGCPGTQSKVRECHLFVTLRKVSVNHDYGIPE